MNAEKAKQPIVRSNTLVRIAAAICMVVVLVGMGMWLNRPVEGEVATSTSKLVFVPAKVVKVVSDNAVPDWENGDGRRAGTQELLVDILQGEHQGEVLSLSNYMSALFNVDVQVGDRVIVRIITNDDGSYYPTMFNYDRGIQLIPLVAVFVILLLVLGGKKGVGALFGLLFTLVCVWWILIPGLIQGLPAMPLTIFIVSVTATASLVALNGWSCKTFCAALGCMAGVVAAGVAAALVGAAMPMDGFNMTEAEDLILYGADKGLDIHGLLVCGVLIASLGAVMDVALSLASAMWEIHLINPDMKPRQLVQSGMQVGKDAMGTMANTLILAFAGASLNLLILIQTYDIPFLQLINTDFLCIEIIQSMAGSIGILLTVPLVAAISAQIMTRKGGSTQVNI